MRRLAHQNFDNERTEEPHATIIWRRQRWRFGLRSGAFLDRRPDPREVPWEIVHALHQGADQLIAAWNALHPINPV